MKSQGNPRIALVTGVGRREGIGFEVCRQLAALGMTTLLTARDLAKAQILAEELQQAGLDVRPLALDVASDASVGKTVRHVEAEFDRRRCAGKQRSELGTLRREAIGR